MRTISSLPRTGTPRPGQAGFPAAAGAVRVEPCYHHGHFDTQNKKIALLVALLAALLAISEMAGKSSQTHGLSDHIDASNLWSFFQAKTIRQTTMRTAAEGADAQFKDNPSAMPPALKAQAEQWRRTAQRYESEPETNEGRKELHARAKAKEAHRDRSLAAYHMFEYASASFQLAIVLAGAAALTAVAWLTFVSLGLGAVGIGFTLLGFLAPGLLHIQRQQKSNRGWISGHSPVANH